MNDLIILAAGRGTRMKGLTEDAPKCLTPLLGRSLLDWQLESARKAGMERVHIVGGYCSHKLPQDLVDFVNPRWAETNMVASLFIADAFLRENPCIVAYSDIVYRHEHLRALSADSHPIAVLYDLDWERLWRLRAEDYLADAESFKTDNGRLLDIGEKGVAASAIQGQYMGLLKFTPRAWEKIREIYFALPRERQDKVDMTSFIRLLLAENMAIATVPISGGWAEVDTESDRDLYEAAIGEAEAKGETWHHDWRAA